MAIFERNQISTLLSRLNEKPQLLTIVTGPRQTGKTTLIRQTLERLDRPSLYVSVDKPDSAALPLTLDFGGSSPEFANQPDVPPRGPRDAGWLVRIWEQARMACQQSDRGFVLVVDEIQDIPDWSRTVKGLWDEDAWHDRHLHAVLLGSAPLLMQHGMSESLAGRFETVHLTHWSFPEMSTAFGFNLKQYIYFGGYPGGARFVREQARWRAYISEAMIEPSIERDILAMQRVDKPALLKRLFQLGTEYSGQILSYNKMLGQLQDAGNTTTLTRYLNLLSKAGLITGLPKFAAGAHRRRASIPKLAVHNTALMAPAAGYTFEEAETDRSYWGRLVESAVGAHLINTGTHEHRLYYWRENGSEVDFVLKRGPRLIAFEVKSGARKPRTSGFKGFTERFGAMETIVVGAGGLSISEFLSTPSAEWFDDR